jgi:hypothetical protein
MLASARRLERTERRIYRALCSCETRLACAISEMSIQQELIGKLREDHRRVMSDIAVRRASVGAMEYVPVGMFPDPVTSLPQTLETVQEEDGTVSASSATPIPVSMPGLDIFCYETIWNSSPLRDETRSSFCGSGDAPVWENLDWLLKDFPEPIVSVPSTSGGPVTC